jgi:hypothetical protein
VLGLEPELAADRVTGYWSAVETAHAARRELADVVVRQLHGKRSVMYEVATREIPSRSLLCLKRHVAGETGAWALGKEFVRLLQEHAAPRLAGPAGAAFCIVWHSLSAWGEEHRVQPTDLGARITYRAPQPRTADSVPDTDFAVPFADRTG